MKFLTAVFLFLCTAGLQAEDAVLKAEIKVQEIFQGIVIKSDFYEIKIYTLIEGYRATLIYTGANNPFAQKSNLSITLNDEEISSLNEYFATMIALQDEFEPSQLHPFYIMVNLNTYQEDEHKETNFYDIPLLELVDKEALTPRRLKERILSEGKPIEG